MAGAGDIVSVKRSEKNDLLSEENCNKDALQPRNNNINGGATEAERSGNCYCEAC